MWKDLAQYVPLIGFSIAAQRHREGVLQNSMIEANSPSEWMNGVENHLRYGAICVENLVVGLGGLVYLCSKIAN